MKKDLYKILVPIGCVLCAILAVLVYIKIINDNKEDNSNDALKFKEEYESLNGEMNQNFQEYKKLEISDNNPVKYADYDELLDIIKNKTGVIYLGFPTCPWCRSALPVLFDVLKDNNIERLYYKNILTVRDSYVVENGKLTYEVDSDGNEIKGEDGYFELLDALDEYLTEYKISYEGKLYETGEKRLYAPTVIFVRDGKVIGLHESTVESQKSGYDELTKEQYEELYSIYEDYILEMTKETCSSDSSC